MRPIVFMLPGLSGKRPVGGFKMVYLYANMLAERGYDVTVVHSVCTDLRHCSNRSRIAPFFRYPQNLLTHSYKKIKWFDLNPLVKSKMVWCFSLMHTDPDTIYVATAVATAYALNSKKILLLALYLFPDLKKIMVVLIQESSLVLIHFPLLL